MPGTVLVLGASARAAAASLRRAGLTPFTIDLFRDRDTELLADGFRCPADEYPAGLFELARKAPPGPWMYTGGLENHPDLIGALAAERELWGNGPDVLKKVRDPLWLAEQFPPGKLGDIVPGSFPRTLPAGTVTPNEGRWLRKPLRGSGGHGVRWLTAGERVPEGSVGQEYVEGVPISVALTPQRSLERPCILGYSRQLVGSVWLHSRTPFGWCGNVTVRRQDLGNTVHTLRDAIAPVVALDRPHGYDVIRCNESRYVPHEINPRYPASLECIEFSELTTMFGLSLSRSSPCTTSVGKAVYYAPFPVRVPESGPWDESLRHCADVWRRPDFADVPHAGERIEAGHPVCTLLAEADTPDACEAELRRRAAEFDTFLEGCRDV